MAPDLSLLHCGGGDVSTGGAQHLDQSSVKKLVVRSGCKVVLVLAFKFRWLQKEGRSGPCLSGSISFKLKWHQQSLCTVLPLNKDFNFELPVGTFC